MSLTTDIIILIALILLSAFFSSAEIALFSLSHAKVRHMVDKNVRGARLIEKMKNRPNELLIIILIGNNVVNIFAAAFATSLAIETFGSVGVGIATGAMTFLILLFGEIFPKSFATIHAQRVSLMAIHPLYFLRTVLYPLVYIFTKITKIISTKKPVKISEEEIRAATDLGVETGAVERDEREMIQKVFKLNDIPVNRVMTFMDKVFSVAGNDSSHEALAAFQKTKFSRATVYEDRPQNIVGVLHVKDIIGSLDPAKNVPVRVLAQKPFFCNADEKLDAMLKKFQKQNQHMAVVRDAKGKIIGIVTLEDIFEELVGEIRDESGR